MEITNKGVGLFSPEMGKQALFLMAQSETRFDFGGDTNSVSFDVAGANSTDTVVTYFYNDGTSDTQLAPMQTSKYNDTVSWDAPEGKLISYITISVGSEGGGTDKGMRIDHFTWGDTQVEPATQMAESHDVSALMSGADANHADASVLAAALENANHQQDAKLDVQHDGQQNTLSLSLNDVLSHGADNLLVNDGHAQVAITGEQGSSVELTGVSEESLTQHGSVTSGGVTYDVYNVSGSDTELLVQHGLELQHHS
jgi:hypothetical protein